MVGSVLFWLGGAFFHAVLSCLKFRYEVSVFSRWPHFFGEDTYRLKYKILKDEATFLQMGNHLRKGEIIAAANGVLWKVIKVIDVDHIRIQRFNGPPLPAPDNWYYRRFRIPYKEKFPGSATVFSCFTDGYHATQWCMTLCLVGAMMLYVNHTHSWQQFIGLAIFYKILWSGFHEYCYSFLFILKSSRDR